jgi:hypothetical protein
MSADGSWSVCTHEHLRSLFLFYALASACHVSRWFMSVCTHEHLTDRCSLTLRLHSTVIADGSWSVCTHEHLTDRCSFSALATASCQQMVHGVFALMNI